jgi:3-hydroxyacyl-CoA dehydrogenase
MKTKTWKLGEWAKGGVITVEITGKIITVIGKDWDFSTGSRKSSDQSNAKEYTRGSVVSTDEKAYLKLINYLNDLTTSYYSDQILEWICEKSEVRKQLFW